MVFGDLGYQMVQTCQVLTLLINILRHDPLIFEGGHSVDWRIWQCFHVIEVFVFKLNTWAWNGILNQIWSIWNFDDTMVYYMRLNSPNLRFHCLYLRNLVIYITFGCRMGIEFFHEHPISFNYDTWILFELYHRPISMKSLMLFQPFKI